MLNKLPANASTSPSSSIVREDRGQDNFLSLFISSLQFTHQSNKQFCTTLNDVKELDDLVSILSRKNLAQYRNNELVDKLQVRSFSALFGILDQASYCSAAFLEKKFDLAKKLIISAREAKDPQSASLVLMQLISTAANSPHSESLKYRQLLNYIFSARPEFMQTSQPDLLTGLDGLALMPALLCSQFNPITFYAMDFFKDNAPLESIITRAYTEDKIGAYKLMTTLLTAMDSLDTGGFYQAELEKYVALINKIKEINTQACRNASSSELVENHLVTAEVLPLLSSRRGEVHVDIGTQAITTDSASQSMGMIKAKLEKTLTRFDEFLTSEAGDEAFSDACRIDTSNFPPSLVDMVEGIEIFRSCLAESSPLLIKLEDFYQRLPSMNERQSPETIKTELISLLKPIFNDLEPSHIYGADLPSLKAVALNMYRILWGNRQPNYGEQGRRRNELPDLERMLTVDRSLLRNNCPYRQNGLKNFIKEGGVYYNGEWSFVQLAKVFKEEFSSGDLPFPQAVRAFIEGYADEAKEYDSCIDLNLESTYRFDSKIRFFKAALSKVSINAAEYREAARILRGLCDSYLERKTNDQTFIKDLREICSGYADDGNIQLVGKINELLYSFMKSSVGF